MDAISPLNAPDGDAPAMRDYLAALPSAVIIGELVGRLGADEVCRRLDAPSIAHSQSGGDETTVRIERPELPPIPEITAREPVDAWSDYAIITCGGIKAKIERWCYWHPNDGQPLEVRFEAKVNGLSNGAGVADLCTDDPQSLRAAAAVITHAALLLEEARWRQTMETLNA